MSKVRRLGVLTSGGDCAGLNAAIRAVVHRAVRGYGWKVFGIIDSTNGLMQRPVACQELTPAFCDSSLLRAGGTFLGTTNKGDPFAYPMPDGSRKDRSNEFVDGFRHLDLDALIVIGGDGSLKILDRLCKQGGLPMVGIPKTIDNDVHLTEYAIGHATAVDVVVDALDRLQPTAASHRRVMIVEVMGRDVGHIALAGGVGGGADVILIPEIPYTLAGVAEKIEAIRKEGRNHAVVVVAEGVKTESGGVLTEEKSGGETRYGGIGEYLSVNISKLTGMETRVAVLGHVQRGGQPSRHDRVLASVFGVHAVDLVAQGKYDVMVAWQENHVTEVKIDEVTVGSRGVDLNDPIIATARGLGIYLGNK